MTRRLLLALPLALAIAGGLAAAQASVDVPWGDETIEIDPALGPVQTLITGMTTIERLGQPEQIRVKAVVLVQTDDGYAIAAEIDVPAKGEWRTLRPGDVMVTTRAGN